LNYNNKINKHLEELEKKIVIIERGNGHNTNESNIQQEEIELIDRETERRRQEWFAKLRLARCRKRDAHGNKTCEDVYEYTTQEEYDYNLKTAILSQTPEERYQDRKQHWYFHDSSYYMRGLGAYDNQGCNPWTGCIPECRFYNEYGRIEGIEVIEKFERHNKPKLISYHVDSKGEIIYHYPERQQTNE
jgi:hypothetical protein